tara:strand:+ start:624 stop:1232 length:609 start_codon:yes stop_codon:yes gene_type:complete
MKKLNISEKISFVGAWNIQNNNLCSKIIDFFENNKKFHQKGLASKGIDEKVKKSTDLSIEPRSLKTDDCADLKNYFDHLYNCYEDYKIQWPFLTNNFQIVDIPTFNIQKYNKGDHFSGLHSERDGISTMYRVFAWMTYLNDVEDGGETYFEHFKLKIKPETGKTLIWPAEWTHAHKGEVLNFGKKYIITGWMNFPFNFQVPQ